METCQIEVYVCPSTIDTATPITVGGLLYYYDGLTQVDVINEALYAEVWSGAPETGTLVISRLGFMSRPSRDTNPCPGINAGVLPAGDYTIVVKHDACTNWSSASSATSITVVPHCECVEGAERSPYTCWNGTTIQQEVCHDCEWVPSGEECPIEPEDGEVRNVVYCWDGVTVAAQDVYSQADHQWHHQTYTCPPQPICEPGTSRTPITCWNGQVIYTEVCGEDGMGWVPSGQECPIEPEDGEVRNVVYCWDGVNWSSRDVYSRTTHSWVTETQACPPQPICDPGEVRGQTTCWDGSLAGGETCSGDGMGWVPIDTTCPIKVCDEGAIKCENEIEYGCVGNEWVATGEACSNEPCTPGAYECRQDGQYWSCVDGSMTPTGVPCGEEVPTGGFPWWLLIPVGIVGGYFMVTEKK